MKRLAFLLAAIPPITALWYIHAYGVNGAHWDHLMNAELFDRYYSGTLTLDFLLKPHLEHLKFFPRLVCLALGIATRFNNVAEMYFQWLLVCATAAVLSWTYARRLGVSGSGLALRLAPVFFVLFSVRQREAMLVGDGMITYMCLFASVTALALLAKGGTGATAMATASAFVASFSHANGFLLWPIGVAVIVFTLSERGVRDWIAISKRLSIWLLPGAAAVAIYVAHWPDTAGTNTAYAFAHPFQAALYALQAAGVYFGQSARLQLWSGIVALLVEAAVAVVAIARYRRGLGLPLGVWFIVFAVLVQGVVALGRAGVPASVGIASRYAVFIGLGIAGAYLAALEMGSRSSRPIDRALIATNVLLLSVGSVLSYADGFATGPAERSARLRSVQVLRTYRLQNDETIVALSFPFPALGRMYAAELEKWKLNVFAEPLLDPRKLADAKPPKYYVDFVNLAPPAARVSVRASDTISLVGWAFDNDRREPYTAAYLRIEPDGVSLPAAYGLDRPDVAKVFGLRRGTTTGYAVVYSAEILPPGEHTLYLDFITRDPARAARSAAIVTVVRR